MGVRSVPPLRRLSAALAKRFAVSSLALADATPTSVFKPQCELSVVTNVALCYDKPHSGESLVMLSRFGQPEGIAWGTIVLPVAQRAKEEWDA